MTGKDRHSYKYSNLRSDRGRQIYMSADIIIILHVLVEALLD